MDSDDTAMDNSSLGEQKTVLTLGRKPLPMPSSKNGNKIHTGLDHSGNCAMTNNLLSGVPFNAMLFDNGATCCCAKRPLLWSRFSVEPPPDLQLNACVLIPPLIRHVYFGHPDDGETTKLPRLSARILCPCVGLAWRTPRRDP